MPFEVPRWWWTGFMVALFVLALGGTLNAVESGMQDNYSSDGCGHPGGGQRPADERPEGVDCSSQRLQMGIVDGLSRATFGPGVAMAILAGVYLLGSAIATALGAGRKEGDDGAPGSSDSDPGQRDNERGRS